MSKRPPRYADLPELCTPEQARAFLQVGRNTLYEMVRTGNLPSVRFGRLIRIPKTALLPAAHAPTPVIDDEMRRKVLAALEVNDAQASAIEKVIEANRIALRAFNRNGEP